MWPGTESNCRHEDFQSSALPTELPGQKLGIFLKSWSESRLTGIDGYNCRFFSARCSMKSISWLSSRTPFSELISWIPVGLVTLTSVR